MAAADGRDSALGRGADADFGGVDDGTYYEGDAVDVEKVEPPKREEEPAGLIKVLSRISRASVRQDPGPPPDGGVRAWTQVGMAHLVIFCTWGYINSYGVFETYYIHTLGHSASDIAWVGSVQIFLLFGISTFSGRATDAGYFRLFFGAGVFLQVLGTFMTSISTQYWQLFLAQGVCTGIGNGLLFCPTISLIPTYFSRKRALALACVSCGTATGGLVFPAMVESLLPRIGFGWTVRTIAFMMLGLSAFAGAFLRTRVLSRTSGPLLELEAFRELPYSLFAVAVFTMFWGIYSAFYYVGEFAESQLGVDQAGSINLLLIMNGIGMPARLLAGATADRFTGPMNLLVLSAAVSALLLYSWSAVHSVAGLYAFSAVYGVFGAVLQGVFPVALSSLTTDMTKMGTRIGMVFSILSFGALTGPPIFGALVQHDGGGYLYGQIFTGTVMLAATVFLLASRTASIGWKLRAKI